jgi:hypothetical protein
MSYEFRTVVDSGKYGSDVIDIDTRVFLAGSCFADNIGAKFREGRLNAMVNPFGVIYNPISIARLFERVMERIYCNSDELVYYNDLWHHFDFHGRFSNSDDDKVCENINQALDSAYDFLQEARFLIITFGSSFVYERTDNSEVVANCHKFPSDFFNRFRLQPNEIVSLYKEMIVSLRVLNPQLNIVFTVSPVRHWKDGAHGNQLSKSVLFLAIDELCNLFDNVHYFSAFEIVMDELRDYRFYDEQMFNPSRQAVDYIWNRFSESLLTPKARQYLIQTAKVAKAHNHRTIGLSSDSYWRFLQKSLALIDDIEHQFPEANLRDDRNYFEKLLNVRD